MSSEIISTICCCFPYSFFFLALEFLFTRKMVWMSHGTFHWKMDHSNETSDYTVYIWNEVIFSLIKLTFACFQLAGWCHSPASWKQTNISFEAFLVGNQGWRIKGQMLRWLMSYLRLCGLSQKATVKIFFLIFLQSIHQVDMKNVVKCA